MSKQQSAPTDTGLPHSPPPSILINGPHGLAVSRLKAAKAIRPSMLAGDELEQFLAKFDRFISSTQDADWRFTTSKSRPTVLRNQMIVPIKKIRTTKSKNLEDVLFKALISELIEPWKCRRSETVAHSIVNDLLSAECQWRA